ncbi:hypothetical protein GCM10025858_07880 [Alicyclobacillus sacchari]|uniref:anti-sigma factor domain-containing protein n=1 Tax=Alicyclobacillus sacchari TaxID=392010 RepID=UPI0023E9351F|nr:anti-sigma factor domain-containing protein [Alicyclobacillus sacchari]GMA56285.1 hypothetical protein GCM10025858_07880 [Alicyclobacillus sacchari]
MRSRDEEKAVILSLDGDRAIVLMRDGTFRRIRVGKGLQVGELCSVPARERRFDRAVLSLSRAVGVGKREWRRL